MTKNAALRSLLKAQKLNTDPKVADYLDAAISELTVKLPDPSRSVYLSITDFGKGSPDALLYRGAGDAKDSFDHRSQLRGARWVQLWMVEADVSYKFDDATDFATLFALTNNAAGYPALLLNSTGVRGE